MKTSTISFHQPLFCVPCKEPIKPFIQKKAKMPLPRLKNFFEMAKEVETERKSKKILKKPLETQKPSSIETALLEKLLILKDSISLKPELRYEPLGSIALVEAVLEKISYQIEKGVEKTSIVFGETSTNPALKGSEISITCYDTDPMRFHLDFFSSAQGVLVLSAQMGHLKEWLEKKFPKQFFSLAPPCLNTYKNNKNPIFAKKSDKITKNSSFY